MSSATRMSRWTTSRWSSHRTNLLTLTRRTAPFCWWYQTRDYRHHKHKRAERQANLYDILAITPKATQTQIKAAYYKLSKIYHPDLNQGSKDTQEKFAAISEAYSVLGNVTLRRRYDRGVFTHRDLHSEVKEKHKATESTKPRQNTSVYYNTAGERMYDFDEFYKAHYGEALKREQRERKERKRRAEEMKKEQDRSQTPVWMVAGISSTVLIIATLLMRRMQLK
ncbi:dnaJ homolog subfamily C member 30, mitochondrial-like [Asterias amurensis]|uniref:dnaJ homolog subfamily C member 30, mitochondrial-like n=1 Tax=Asterias amurensis TaxID=7602 RepID=UPI003AB135E0